MKILITGGAGFIGSAVVRHIINDTNDSVINIDSLTYAGNLESLEEIDSNERYAFEQVDICDRAALDRVFAEHKPDAVMHLAAESHVDRLMVLLLSSKRILSVPTIYSRLLEHIGSILIKTNSKLSAFITFLLMKYMVTSKALMTCLLKKPLTSLPLLTLLQKRLATTCV